MTKGPVISRRLLLAGLWLAGSSSARAQKVRGDDHGIGGTGIVGVIQRFGSIFVNGERIGYAPNVPVRIDGELTSPSALRIGHVARVLALRQANGTLATSGIEAVSEAIGPIETLGNGEMTVLGQKVIWAGRESWRRPGSTVAVFGLRRTDGVIVASLVQKRRDSATRVSGLLERDHNGMRIGGLRLSGVDPALVGHRVQVEGQAAQGVMQISRARRDDFSDLSGASHLLIEAYVRRTAAGLQLGSGYVAHDTSRFQPANDVRVVVNAVFDASNGLRVESIQSVDKFPGATLQGPGHSGQGQVPGQGPGQGSGQAPGPGQGGPGGSTVPGGQPNAPGGPGPGGGSVPGDSTAPGGFGSPAGPPGFGGGPGPGGGGFGGGPGGGRH